MRGFFLIGIVALSGCASPNTAPGSASTETARVVGSGGEGTVAIAEFRSGASSATSD